MIKAALRYLMEEMSPAKVIEANGEEWSDRKLYRINHNPKASPIELYTLSSLVDYLKSSIDDFPKLIVHVKSPTRVSVYSNLDYDRERECLVEVSAQLPDFRFNQYMDHEEFCINLQSKFIDNGDRALLLKFAGTVEAGSVAQYGDDGVTQKATVKTGVASKSDAVVPNPVILTAYRTFLEVEQPAQQFIFRMQQGNTGSVICALFEADGGAWRIDAVENVRLYLEEQLEDIKDILIIA